MTSRKWLALASLISVLGLYGCEDDSNSNSNGKDCDSTYTGECIDDTMFMYCDNGSYAIKECTSCKGNVCDNSFVPECTTNTCATNTMIKECGSDGKYQAPRSCGEGKICSIDSCIDDPNPGQKCTVDECNSDGMLLKCEGGYFAAPESCGEKVCKDGACEEKAECTTNDECAAKDPSKPICNESGVCVAKSGCTSNDECAAIDPSKPICNASGVCVVDPNKPECESSDDCTNPGRPVCNTTTHKCEPRQCVPGCDVTEKCVNGECKPKTPEPEVTSCGELTISGSDTCEISGSSTTKYVLRGDVLGLNDTWNGGSVVIENGRITYVGCDPNMANATVITCPNAVISPSFINGHEHITFSNAKPGTWGKERFDHRHDWRKGKYGHTKVPGPGTSTNEVVEMRAIMGGTTSIFGSGSIKGLTRNIDKAGLGSANAAVYQTFPLGDSGGAYYDSGCDKYSYHSSATKTYTDCAYGPHIAEGINQGALNELRCLGADPNTNAPHNVFNESLAVIHGIAATPNEVATMAKKNVKLVWSPRTNVSLYGDTAIAPMYDAMGVTLALGTDWIYSGSANMLRELACVDYLNQHHYSHYFSDYQIWKMPTYNTAYALGFDGVLGQIKAGMYADIAVFRKIPNVRESYRAVIDAENKDVVLVMINGKPVYGDANLIKSSNAESVSVCGVNKKVDTKVSGSDMSYSQINQAAQYPLFFCDTPANEPTCVPSRTRAADTTNSTMYTGDYTAADDADGDGIKDSVDNCPTIFNPVRPQNTDGKQADADNDHFGDACDPYPLCPTNDSKCATFNPELSDRDEDGVIDRLDNCLEVYNPDQLDSDLDNFGDVCDPCPNDGNNEDGKGCSLTVTPLKELRDKFNAETIVYGPVKIEGVVTAIARKYDGSGIVNGIFIQAEDNSAGIYIYTANSQNLVAGDLIEVKGNTMAYNGLLEISPVDSIQKKSSGHTITPVELTAAGTTQNTNDTKGHNQYDSMLIHVPQLTVNTYDQTIKNNAFVCTDENGDTAYIDDFVMGTPDLTAAVSTNVTYDVTGILVYDNGYSRIAPRDSRDLIAGFGVLELVAPKMAEYGDQVDVTLNMTMAAEEETTVNISCTPNTAQCPATVKVPKDASSASFSITVGNAAETKVTASFDGKSVSAAIAGIDPTLPLAIASYSPESVALSPGKSRSIAVTLNKPVKTATSITLSSSNADITVPASVDLAVGATSAEFTITASAGAVNGTSATITAAIGSESITIPVNIVKADWDYIEDFEGITKSSTSYVDAAVTLTHDDFATEFKARTNLENSGVSYAIKDKGVILGSKSGDGNYIKIKNFTGGVGKIDFDWRSWGAAYDSGTILITVGGITKELDFTKAATTATKAEFDFNISTASEIEIKHKAETTNRGRIIIDNIRVATN